MPVSLYILVASVPPVPFDGIWYMQDGVLADPSYLDGVEPISATTTTNSTEHEAHIELKIQKEQAERMIKSSVLKECVDSSTKFSGLDYECSDPVWEKPDRADTTYPTNDKDILCTRSWLDLSVLADIPNHGFTDESNSVLCVNPKTGVLWYAYYGKSSAGWE